MMCFGHIAPFEDRRKEISDMLVAYIDRESLCRDEAVRVLLDVLSAIEKRADD